MDIPKESKISLCKKGTFPFFVICSLFCCVSFLPLASGKAFANSAKKLKNKHHAHIVHKHVRTAEEDLEAKEVAQRLAQEAKLNEGRNSILAKAYTLYDSGTSEYLQGNYKYAVLQLKLADELLQEHGQANTSLAIANLISLTNAAEASKDYVLAKASCQRLLANREQDTALLLKLAKIEIAQGNIKAARNTINKISEISPSNAEAQLLNDLAIKAQLNK